MASPTPDRPFRFLDLPVELRKHVYKLLFFGGEEDRAIQPAFEIERPLNAPRSLTETPLERTTFTASRQIHPYDRPEPIEILSISAEPPPYRELIYKSLRRYPLAIFRVNHAVQAESELTFYGSASFNLMGGQSHKKIASWEWLSQLPRRYLRLIRRVEHFCYIETMYSLFDWTLFMKMLSQECPALQSLRLWVHSDEREFEWLADAQIDDSWVQAILQLQDLQDLRRFDMPGIKPLRLEDSQHSLVHRMFPTLQAGPQHVRLPLLQHYHREISPWLRPGNVPRPIDSEPSDTASIVPWLQARLVENNPLTESATSRQDLYTPLSTFPILDLPPAIRSRIYRHILLPANKQLHPYIKSWYNETTRNAVPLLLTCRLIREEAEDVLYGSAVFTVPETSKIAAAGALQKFFEELPRHLRTKVHRVLLPGFKNFRTPGLLKYLAEEMNIEALICQLPPGEASSLDNLRRQRRSWKGQFQENIGRIKGVRIDTNSSTEIGLLPNLRAWIQVELREKWTTIEQRRKSLRKRRVHSAGTT